MPDHREGGGKASADVERTVCLILKVFATYTCPTQQHFLKFSSICITSVLS